MPKARRRKRPSPRKSVQRAYADMRHHLLEVEVPLRDATHFVQALHFIGMGLIAEYDEAGEPVTAVASAAAARLETLRTIWDRIFEAGRGVGKGRKKGC